MKYLVLRYFRGYRKRPVFFFYLLFHVDIKKLAVVYNKLICGMNWVKIEGLVDLGATSIPILSRETSIWRSHFKRKIINNIKITSYTCQLLGRYFVLDRFLKSAFVTSPRKKAPTSHIYSSQQVESGRKNSFRNHILTFYDRGTCGFVPFYSRNPSRKPHFSCSVRVNENYALKRKIYFKEILALILILIFAPF